MIFKYKATIPESKTFVREYEVKSDMNLFKFNSFILNDLGFAPDQMVIFRGIDANGVLCSDYGLFDLGDGSMDKVTFADVVAKGETELQYCYDVRNDRVIKLLYEGEEEGSPRYSYPRTTFEKGRNPDQFSKKYEDFDEFEEFNHGFGEEVEEVVGEDNDE